VKPHRLSAEADLSPSPTQLVELANRARATAGCGALRWDAELAAAAQAHGRDLVWAESFSHTGSDGSNVLHRVRRHSTRWRLVGENLASGMSLAEDAIVAWLNSPAHRDNLLNADFTHVGSGIQALRVVEGFMPGYLFVQVYGRFATT